MALAVFRDLPAIRQKEVASAIAHYIAGVLDREAMIAVVDSLTHSANLQVGDRVKTLRGSMRGVIVRMLDDGRVALRRDGGGGRNHRAAGESRSRRLDAPALFPPHPMSFHIVSIDSPQCSLSCRDG